MLELKCDFLKRGYGNGSRCAVHCGGDRGTPHRQDQSPSAWIISLYRKGSCPWERLLRLVPERDLRLAAALKPASRREEFLMWRSIVYRRLPDAEIAYNAVGAPSYAIIPPYRSFPLPRIRCGLFLRPSMCRRYRAACPRFRSGGSPLLLPKSGGCPTVRCCCRPSGAPRETLYKYSGRRNLDLLRDLRIERFDRTKGRMTGRICGNPHWKSDFGGEGGASCSLYLGVIMLAGVIRFGTFGVSVVL